MNNSSIFRFLKVAPKLFIYLETNCNLNCNHCYLGYRLKQNIKFHQNDVLNIIDSFALLNGKKDVTFLGGEPTLHPDIDNILKYAKKKGYYVRLDTNGFYNTNRLLLNIDLDNIDEISISLDGASPKTHDKIRTIGAFEFAINNIRYLKKIKKRVRVTTTVMRPNLCEIPKIAQLARNIGVDILNLHLLSLNGNASNHPELWVSPEEWLCLIVKIWEISYLRIRFPLAYLPKSLVKDIDEDFLKCEISDLTRLSFFPDGKVYCCSILFDTDLNVGSYNFNKKSIFIRNNSEFYHIRSRGSCIAKDFMTQQENFINICRFKKMQNNDKRYGNLISKIKETLKCGEVA